MIIDDFAVVCGLPAVLCFLFPKPVNVQRGCKCTRYGAGSMLSGCDGAERLRWSSIYKLPILSTGFPLSAVFACSLSCCLAFCLDKVSTQFSPNQRQLLNCFFVWFFFWFCFFRANVFFCRKSEPLQSRGRIYRNARVPYVSHFLHSQIPLH